MSFTSFLRSLGTRRGPNRRSHHNRFAPRLEALDSRDVPATFQVINLADTGPGSLRQAVLDANANPGADDIDFAVTGAILLTSGQLAITDGVAINGPGADLLTVTQGNFVVGSAATVQLSGLTLSGGTGGAITNYGALTISDCTLSGNSRVGVGGAIYSDGTLTVRHSTISGNSAYGSFDYVNAFGGGIYVAGGTLTLSSSTVANNGVYGVLFNDLDYGFGSYGAFGGGVYVAGGTVSIDHSTIAGNHADRPAWADNSWMGGGVFNAAGQDALRLYNSILADNTTWHNTGYDVTMYHSDLSGTVTSLGHNLIGDSAGGAGYVASDLLNVDPRLGPLQNNGGPTPTMAVLAGSPAINAGDNTGAPAYDQRGAGFPRIFGDTIDIGAFEAQMRLLPTISITDVSLPEGNVGATAASFTVRLSSASTETVTVNYSTADGSATASDGDYQNTSGTLTFAPGEIAKTITVWVTSDRLPEPNETFVVNLSNASNAILIDGQGVGTILDDEPRISINDVSKQEGRKGKTTLFTFTVTLSAAYDQVVTMSFKTVNGTATTSDSDYVAKSGTITFAPGETTKTITIEVKGDGKRESNEVFYLDLFDLSGNAVFTKNRGIGTILNDD